MAYETGWISIVEFQTGQEVSNKFDLAFENIDNALTDIENRLDATESATSDNTQAISDLDDRVGDNADLDTTEKGTIVGAINELVGFIPPFERHWAKETVLDVLDIPDTWTPVVAVPLATLEAGTYMFGFSLHVSFTDANDAIYIRYSIDGGTEWHTFAFTAPVVVGTDNNLPVVYAFPYDAADGDWGLMIEAQKDTGANTFDINFADAWIERKA